MCFNIVVYAAACLNGTSRPFRGGCTCVYGLEKMADNRAQKTRISVWCMTGPLLRKNHSKDGRENKIIAYELLYNAVFSILYVAAPGVVVGYYRGNRVRNRN